MVAGDDLDSAGEVLGYHVPDSGGTVRQDRHGTGGFCLLVMGHQHQAPTEVLRRLDAGRVARRCLVLAKLTPREVDVLRLLTSGRSNRDIAEALFVGHRTVQTHVARLLGKFGVNSRAEAATLAVRNDFV